MFHRIWAIGAAVTLMVLPLGASAAEASGPAGVPVAAGIVTGTTGAAMPGATVDLYAWPADPVLSALKSGEMVPTTLLATTTTSSTGAYTLAVPGPKLEAAAVESGYANLEIYTPFGGVWFFPYPAGPPTAQTVTVNLGGKKSKPVCGLDGAQPYGFSGFAFRHKKNPAWAIVGQGYILHQAKTAGDTLAFKYTKNTSRSQNTSLGVGVSGYGFDAGYTVSGDHESTAARPEAYPSQQESSWFSTEFKTGQFRGICYGHTGVKVPREHQHGRCPSTYERSYVHKCIWMIKSVGWFGGQQIQHPKAVPSTPSGNCAIHPKGATFGGDDGKAVTWTSGWDLGAALGIKGANLKASFNGSAQTGYDTGAHMAYYFAQKGYLCGTNAPESTAAIIVQRGNKS